MCLIPRVAEQWILDTFSRVEAVRAAQLSHNKNVNDARSATFKDIANRTSSGVAGLGRKWTLPASHYGTPAYVREKIAEGMAVISKLGDPSLFITITMNPKWKEVEVVHADADPLVFSPVLVRVFRAKLLAVETALRNGDILGRRTVYVQRCCEFQQRGLIHAHVLVRLHGNPLRSGDDVDKLVCARLWQSERCPQSHLGGCRDQPICDACRLREIVKHSMTHTCSRRAGGCRDPAARRKFKDPSLCNKVSEDGDTLHVSGRRWPMELPSRRARPIRRGVPLGPFVRVGLPRKRGSDVGGRLCLLHTQVSMQNAPARQLPSCREGVVARRRVRRVASRSRSVLVRGIMQIAAARLAFV